MNQELDTWRDHFGSEGLESVKQFTDKMAAAGSTDKEVEEYVDNALELLDDETERFVWKSAPDSEVSVTVSQSSVTDSDCSKGFGMQEMILRTFKKAHLDKVNVSMNDVPFAAILLSFVAVSDRLEPDIL